MDIGTDIGIIVSAWTLSYVFKKYMYNNILDKQIKSVLFKTI